MPRKHAEIPAISAELSEADLGDERLNRRLGLLADQLAKRPDESFPKALDDSQLEAAYRFFGNDRVSVAEAALKHGIHKICRRAGLPPRSWHSLRHTFATHAARFGVNPWRL